MLINFLCNKKTFDNENPTVSLIYVHLFVTAIQNVLYFSFSRFESRVHAVKSIPEAYQGCMALRAYKSLRAGEMTDRKTLMNDENSNR